MTDRYRFGLIGKGISHSSSPELFRKAFPSPEYSYTLIDCNTFAEGISEARAKGMAAVNVTSPYKDEAFSFAIRHDPVSERTGTSNLIVLDGEQTTSYNTDYYGVLDTLRERFPGGKGVMKIAVAGCGGAGKAAIAAAADFGARVYAVNRTYGKCAEFCKRAGAEAVRAEEAKAAIESCDLLIYALDRPADFIRGVDLSHMAVFEANYKNPTFGPDSCRTYIDGKAWLINQALPSYEIFRGKMRF